jgi:hypothetical protein
MARILYVALAEARGHLMRAHVLRGLLGDRGVEVDVVTTSRSGQTFLASLGTPSELLSEHFRVEFDGRHNMARLRTDARTAAYLLSPGRCRRDLRTLDTLARGADLVVDDSFHPAMLFAHRRFPLVHVYGENMWRAVLENLDGRTALARPYRWAMEHLKRRAFGHVEHTVATRDLGRVDNHFRLPPIIPALGTPRNRDRRTAVAYLNPRFRDPAIAAAVEDAARRHRLELHAVGEGYADRRGWIARDPELVDSIASADLFISGAGMGALGMATTFEVPFVCLLGRQPEQRANIEQLGPLPTVRVLDLDGGLDGGRDSGLDSGLGGQIATAAADLTFRFHRSARPDPTDQIRALHRQWTEAFEHLLARASGRAATPAMERTDRVTKSAS